MAMAKSKTTNGMVERIDGASLAPLASAQMVISMMTPLKLIADSCQLEWSHHGDDHLGASQWCKRSPIDPFHHAVCCLALGHRHSAVTSWHLALVGKESQ